MQVPDFTQALNRANVQTFMGGSQQGSSVQPRVLLVTNKHDSPGVFRALALNLRHSADYAFGWVHHEEADQPIFNSFKVN